MEYRTEENSKSNIQGGKIAKNVLINGAFQVNFETIN